MRTIYIVIPAQNTTMQYRRQTGEAPPNLYYVGHKVPLRPDVTRILLPHPNGSGTNSARVEFTLERDSVDYPLFDDATDTLFLSGVIDLVSWSFIKDGLIRPWTTTPLRLLVSLGLMSRRVK